MPDNITTAFNSLGWHDSKLIGFSVVQDEQEGQHELVLTVDFVEYLPEGTWS